MNRTIPNLEKQIENCKENHNFYTAFVCKTDVLCLKIDKEILSIIPYFNKLESLLFEKKLSKEQDLLYEINKILKSIKSITKDYRPCNADFDIAEIQDNWRKKYFCTSESEA